jgi:7-carboxy-7-deazaguanine synthase
MIRVDEIYVSVQGEGPRVGLPTVFVRFGGCNLRCPGWPCDTQHAILPEFRDNWIKRTVIEIYNDIIYQVDNTPKMNICFTGGEPFLQPNKDFKELVHLLSDHPLIGTIECFTNGTLAYPDWAIESIHFIMDWKLPGSGEDPLNQNRLTNLKELGEKDAIKFVIKDVEDFDVARELYVKYVQDKSLVQVFYGVAWGSISNADLIDMVLTADLPWRLNMQIHNIIWDRNLRGI